MCFMADAPAEKETRLETKQLLNFSTVYELFAEACRSRVQLFASALPWQN